MTALAGRDASALLECLQRVTEIESLGAFPHQVVDAVARVVPADVVAFNAVDLESRRTTTLTRPEIPDATTLVPEFARLAQEHPVIAHMARTGDGSARMISDFVSQRELHRLELYQDVFRHTETEHQLAISVTAGSTMVIGVALNRRRPRFSERDRTLLDLVRPTLVSTHRLLVMRARMQALIEAVQLDGAVRGDGLRVGSNRLTGREVEVLARLCGGRTNKQIAEVLDVSPRTVQKHLEHIYEKLQTTNRAGAAMRFAAAWHALQSPVPDGEAAPSLSA